MVDSFKKNILNQIIPTSFTSGTREEAWISWIQVMELHSLENPALE